MNIGTLSEDNRRFVHSYKKIGYSTRTRLIEDALRLLRQKKDADLRRTRLTEAGQRYREDYVWQALDGDDYEG